jgi:hypothetical protein
MTSLTGDHTFLEELRELAERHGYAVDESDDSVVTLTLITEEQLAGISEPRPSINVQREELGHVPLDPEDPVRNCATCDGPRYLTDLPRVTVSVTTGVTLILFSESVCYPCLKILAKMLHERFCPQDCEQEHAVR